jgi:hypothetical protein
MARQFREKDGRWCEMTVRLENGRLSVTGSEGTIVTAKEARKMAIEYWESFFEDRNELGRMALEYGKRTARSAAKYVVQIDGEYHGLDVHMKDGNKVYLTESCGQIRETLEEWFPETYPKLAPWHLNDMHAECAHQQARGETYKTHPGAECPDCGYKLGSAWTRRELPAEITQLVAAL